MSMATRTDTQSPALHVADSHDLIRVQDAREQPDNITQCARCPSPFTQLPGRGILRTSPRRRSKKFVTISHIQAPAKITHLSDTSTLPQEYAADVVWGPALEDAGVETEIRL